MQPPRPIPQALVLGDGAAKGRRGRSVAATRDEQDGGPATSLAQLSPRPTAQLDSLDVPGGFNYFYIYPDSYPELGCLVCLITDEVDFSCHRSVDTNGNYKLLCNHVVVNLCYHYLLKQANNNFLLRQSKSGDRKLDQGFEIIWNY